MQQPMHNMLTRQLKRHLGRADAMPSEWLLLIQAVNDAYHEFDKDRGLMERSLELSSGELIQANADLRESERALTALISNLPGMVYRCANDPNWTMQFVSDGCKDVTGYEASELAQNRAVAYGDLVHPDDRDWLWNKCQASLQARTPCHNVYRIIARSGETRWVWERAAGIYAADGTLLSIEGFVQDITERKQVEEALRESEGRFRSYIEHAPVAVFVSDRQSRFTDCNRAAAALLGYDAATLKGMTALDLHPQEDRAVVQQAMETLARDGHVEGEFRMKRRDGRIIWVSLSVGSIGAGAALGYCQDITERKRAEDEIRKLLEQSDRDRLGILEDEKRAEEEIRKLNEDLERHVGERTAALETANKELEAFSYSVSHDLRAPLRAIDGFSQAVLEQTAGRVGEEAEGNLKRVRAAAQRMSRLIDDLLGLFRLSRRLMRREQVDLSRVARVVLEDFQRRDPKREVSVVVQDGMMADGDAVLLGIAVQNLLDNAWKFTGKQDTACIEFGMTEKDGQRVFFVRDDGVGFDMAYADKLFGAFQRLHTEAEFSGSGIGLATVLRIIHRHGGRVWAEGAVDEGATFYFTLPEHEEVSG
ncbi:MAG: PAS domain S-box protein [Verrucomicrobiota bacterium]